MMQHLFADARHPQAPSTTTVLRRLQPKRLKRYHLNIGDTSAQQDTSDQLIS